MHPTSVDAQSGQHAISRDRTGISERGLAWVESVRMEWVSQISWGISHLMTSDH